MHETNTGVYTVVAPSSTVKSSVQEGRTMISSGARDALFSIVDSVSFKPTDPVVLEIT
jgi:hypothetical protein